MLKAFLGPLLLCTLVPLGSAQTIFSNLDASNTSTNTGYGVNGTPGVGYLELAMGFVATASGQLGRIRIPIFFDDFSSSGPNSATVFLLTDSSGRPGTTMGSWTINTLDSWPFSSVHSARVISVTSGASLSAGTTYWLAAAAPTNTQDVWGWTPLGGTLLSSLKQSPNGNWSSGQQVTAAGFSLEAVPEPSMLLILSLGFSATARRRAARSMQGRRGNTPAA